MPESERERTNYLRRRSFTAIVSAEFDEIEGRAETDTQGLNLRNPYGPMRSVRTLLSLVGKWFLMLLGAFLVFGLLLQGAAGLVGEQVYDGVGSFFVELATWYSRPFVLLYVLAYAVSWGIDVAVASRRTA